MQVHTPGGPLELGQLDVPEPAERHVRVKVEACGICHSDSFVVAKAWPGITLPRSPGHEVAGTVDALGTGVEGWTIGARVGVGWFGGNCGYCDRCRRGDFITCRRLAVPGMAYDGGYADYMVVPASALARIPDELSAVEAAPLLCAGVTTFNSLRASGARPGDLVAILGIGGLGHLGVQYAAKMGFETVAIARGTDKEELARSLGARHYIDSDERGVATKLGKLGGARVILATATDAKAMAATVGGLGIDGQLLILGAAQEPLQLNTAMMIGSRQSVRAWPSGSSADSEDALAFSVLAGVRAHVETLPLERAQEGYDRMMSGAARFRMVLTTAAN